MATAPARRAPARKAPPRRMPARPTPVRRPATAAKPAHPRGAAVLDALLHGRGWIALVFVLLAGIVVFNVDLLRMNRQIAATATEASDTNRDNARLRALTARLGSSERIQEVAARAGLVLPAPGEVRYLRSNPSVDGDNAAKRLEEDPGVAAAPVVPEPIEPVVEAPPAIDPVTGAPIDPATGAPVAEPVAPTDAPIEPAPVEPSTGVSYDPVTGAPLDPVTGAPAG